MCSVGLKTAADGLLGKWKLGRVGIEFLERTAASKAKGMGLNLARWIDDSSAHAELNSTAILHMKCKARCRDDEFEGSLDLALAFSVR